MSVFGKVEMAAFLPSGRWGWGGCSCDEMIIEGSLQMFQQVCLYILKTQTKTPKQKKPFFLSCEYREVGL